MRTRKQIIKESGYRQSWLAEKVKVNNTQLTNWVHHRTTIRNDVVINLARILKCRIAELRQSEV